MILRSTKPGDGGEPVHSITLGPLRRDAIGDEAVYRHHLAFARSPAEFPGSNGQALRRRPEKRMGEEGRGMVASSREGGDVQVLGEPPLVKGSPTAPPPLRGILRAAGRPPAPAW